MKLRHVLTGLALGAAACNALYAQTVGRVISGYPAGGAVDQLARIFADEFGKGMGKPYIVESHTGAGGQIAAEMLKRAAADGNTLLLAAASNITIYPHTVRKPSYNLDDFAAVAIAGEYDTGLAIKPHPQVTDFKSFLALGKTDPAMASYATPGAGSLPNFYGMLLGQATGLSLTHVPYRGTGPAINDVIAGHTGSVISPVGTLVPQAKAGMLRMVATTGTQRSRQMPEVPTFRELGFPQLAASAWFGIFVPAATPPQVIERLNEIAVKAVRNPAIRERLIALDVEPREMTPAAFSDRIRAESVHWGKVVKASGFVADGQ